MAWHHWQQCEECGGYRTVDGVLDHPSSGARLAEFWGEDPPGPPCHCGAASAGAPNDVANEPRRH